MIAFEGGKSRGTWGGGISERPEEAFSRARLSTTEDDGKTEKVIEKTGLPGGEKRGHQRDEKGGDTKTRCEGGFGSRWKGTTEKLNLVGTS